MIFIGNFLHLTNQEEVAEADRRHGEFNLMVEAPEAGRALELFKTRIAQLRREKQFFDGVCRIYLVQLLEFDRPPDHAAVMLSFKSVAGDPAMPYIGCLLPTDKTDWCRIFDWEHNRPRIDGQQEAVFMAFED